MSTVAERRCRGITVIKKILVLGATGAMGTYLVPKLIERGYEVDGVTMEDAVSNTAGLKYFKENAIDEAVITQRLKKGYDGIVDFMIYNNGNIPFPKRMPLLLENTDHYMYFSSYRVFANEETPVTERSPRLLDVSKDEKFLASDDYSLYKAKGENALRESSYKNYTILRPAITYSKKRSQLVTLERPQLLAALRENRPVILPENAKNIEGTMSWAGDIAEMIARLLFNNSALCEDFNLTTSEHHKWGEIAEYYKDLFGLECEWISQDEYLSIFDECWRQAATWQLEFDRLFNRIMDNTKVLNATDMKQSEMMTLYDGLKLEHDNILAD